MPNKSRFRLAHLAIVCGAFGVVLPASIARAAATNSEFVARFDAIIIPAVAKSIRQPPTQQGGQIAWGESYQLSALVEMFAATRDSKYAPLIVQLCDWMVKSRDDRQQLRDEFRGRIVNAWSSTNYSQGKRYAWAVHTGMIAAPMARFAAVVRQDPALRRTWGEDASRILQAAGEAVAVHDTDYRPGPGDNEGHLYSLYLKKHLPLNMQNALARAWLAIDDANDSPKYHERIARLAQFLKNRLRAMSDGSYVWAYWPPLEGRAESFEDISHAAINVDFMILCRESNIVFGAEDLVRLERTLLQRVLLADDRVCDTVGGGDKFNKYPAAVLRWGRLGRHFPAVHERLVRYIRSPALGSEPSALPMGFAYLSTPSMQTNNSEQK